MRKLSILFVTSDRFPPFRPAAKVIFGGELARRGHRVDWLVQAASASVEPGPRPFGGGTAYVARTEDGGSRLRRLWKYLLDLRNDLRVFSLLRRGEYSLVQVKDKFITALIPLAAARRHGVPFVYWLAYPHPEASLYAAKHGMARYRVFYLLRGVLQKRVLYGVLLPAARHVFVQSEQMKEDVAREGISAAKMTPVPSSVDLEEIDAACATTVPKPAAERWIVYAGTLRRERGLDFLVRVLRHTLTRVPCTRLVLVGAGDMPADEEMLRQEARRLGVDDHVSITGWLPMPDAWAYVRSADVCLSPYLPVPILRSTSPTKLVEYMALGRPVVANDHPEQTAVIAASGAGIVCPWDEERFFEAVVELLENREKSRAMGEAGRAYVERHRTHSAIADVVEARYRAILEGESGSSAVRVGCSAEPPAAPRRSPSARPPHAR